MGYVSWKAKARPKQLPPKELDWLIWVIRTGRGWGKNFCAANNTIDFIRAGLVRHGALIAPTAADARDMMVDPDHKNSGILPNCPSDFYPKYEPSKRQLVFPNGAILTTYSAEDPEQLRGPSHDYGWLDEIAAWKSQTREATWSNFRFSLRKGLSRTVITSTPKPLLLLKNIEKMYRTVVTRGSTKENMHNLSQVYIENIVNPYVGTRLGLQELDGEFLEENMAALFSMEIIERNRIALPEVPHLTSYTAYRLVQDVWGLPDLKSGVIVVAVDPTGTEEGHGVGITVGARAGDLGYMLEDRSLDSATPYRWAKQVLDAAEDWEANYIVVETNFGGDMVASTLRLVAQTEGRICPPIKETNASRGKTIRAEPISGLAQQNRIKFVGVFPKLEDQLYELESGQTNDRADAFVWQFNDLLEKFIPRIKIQAGNAKVDRPSMGPVQTVMGNLWNKTF
jgi:phage terminase large subunit-like protein